MVEISRGLNPDSLVDVVVEAARGRGAHRDGSEGTEGFAFNLPQAGLLPDEQVIVPEIIHACDRLPIFGILVKSPLDFFDDFSDRFYRHWQCLARVRFFYFRCYLNIKSSFPQEILAILDIYF